ncbi:PREDICTED: DExH-box ATP-dependent RNA helicase DExH17-like [Prunus mume]|uniref:DExH-box ATP-dependent RNA helicase DExH17-like n=1 Tax=Prunus mume TaxID=102107 RepID=A0ABM1LP87_PRUMU|nr:PREDICTED: DExH-box ATP-dependent RNA helicase DExH17-like [Prunus mume]
MFVLLLCLPPFQILRTLVWRGSEACEVENKSFWLQPQKEMNFYLKSALKTAFFDILMKYSRGKSALIFCSTRKSAQEAAQRLSQTVTSFGHSNPSIKNREQQKRLREASLSCSDNQMQSYIPYGVGYQDGGLSIKDRNLIESLFLKDVWEGRPDPI